MVQQLNAKEAILLVVDLQGNLLTIIDERQRVVARSRVMIEAAKILEIPIVVSEQYKKGLGETTPEIKTALGEQIKGYEKTAFGCLDDSCLREAIGTLNRKQIILIGIETQVCIMQTALKAMEAGYTVFLAEDALGSRRASDRETALRRMQQAGAIPATVEMLIMEALGGSAASQFKAILPLLREV